MLRVCCPIRCISRAATGHGNMNMMRCRASALLRQASLQHQHQRWASQRSLQGGKERFRRQTPRAAKTETRDGEAVPPVRGELLYGIHSVSQALASGHRRAHALYVRDGAGSSSSNKNDLAALSKIQSLAADGAVEIKPIRWEGTRLIPLASCHGTLAHVLLLRC
jgi:hypothetical protein